MPSFAIRDLPEELHERLRQRADANRRSMTQEALRILEAALDERAGPPTLDEVDDLRVRGDAPLTDDLLRQARSTGRP